mmetsp:Transcript_18916/g.52098  ORF Transcript_18916/g.52098 Transcript_18916/m.52098 type:complete len:206 (+) Transcript_18916:283-900(+)
MSLLMVSAISAFHVATMSPAEFVKLTARRLRPWNLHRSVSIFFRPFPEFRNFWIARLVPTPHEPGASSPQANPASCSHCCSASVDALPKFASTPSTRYLRFTRKLFMALAILTPQRPSMGPASSPHWARNACNAPQVSGPKVLSMRTAGKFCRAFTEFRNCCRLAVVLLPQRPSTPPPQGNPESHNHCCKASVDVDAKSPSTVPW